MHLTPNIVVLNIYCHETNIRSFSSQFSLTCASFILQALNLINIGSSIIQSVCALSSYICRAKLWYGLQISLNLSCQQQLVPLAEFYFYFFGDLTHSLRNGLVVILEKARYFKLSDSCDEFLFIKKLLVCPQEILWLSH